MATRYWVGGSGQWNTSNTVSWSATSGGSGGASIPTSADDVVFDSGSGGAGFVVTITTANVYCNNFTVSASIAGSASIQRSASTAINIYGSFSLPSGTGFAFDGTLINFKFLGSGSNTITLNGVSLQSNTLSFDNSSGSWTLGSALVGSSSVVLTSGSFITGGFAVTCGSFSSIGSSSRAINLGASTVTVSGASGWVVSSTGWTSFNAGTSTINLSASGPTFTGGGNSYYNIGFTGTAAGAVTITDGFSANNLSFSAQTANGGRVSFGGDISLSGTVSVVTASANNRRRFLFSSVTGTTRTITCASNVTSFGTVDLRDIAISAPSTVTGTSVGNCGGNSGITFTAAKTVYWNLVAGGPYHSSIAWALTSGGVASFANYPLPQDTLIFNNTGLNAGSTVTLSASVNIPNFNAGSLTNACTLANSNTSAGYSIFNGSLSIGNFTPSGASNTSYTFTNRNSSLVLVDTNSKTFASSITVEAPGGGIKITGTNADWTNANGVTLNSGTIDLSDGFSISAVKFSSNYTGVARGFVFGFGGSLNLSGSGAAVFNVTDGTGMTVSGYGGSVNLTHSGSGSISIVSHTGGNPSASFPFQFSAGTYNLTFLASGSDGAKNVDFTGFSGSWSNTFAPGATLYGGITFSPTMSFTTGYVDALTIGAPDSSMYAITTNGNTIPFPVQVVGAAGSLWLLDAYTTTSGFMLTTGNLNLNGQTLTTTAFLVNSAVPKNLTFDGGTISVSGDFTATGANLTTTAGTGYGYIAMTSALTKTFAGGGFDYAATLQQSGAGPLTISGDNTFYDIANTTQPVTVEFAAGSTNTFSNFSLSGTLGNQVTIASNTSATHTLSKPTGTVNVSYCTISYSVATGGATWDALTANGNIDNGSNTGWNFSGGPPSGSGGKFLMLF